MWRYTIVYRMTQVKFVGRISSMGSDRLIINIPKDFHNEIKKIKTRQVKVSIEEAY